MEVSGAPSLSSVGEMASVSSIQPDPESTAPDAMTYDMPGPPPYDSTNIFSVITNVRDTADYINGALFTGKDCNNRDLTIGNRFFLKSGTCDSIKSVPECRGQSRYIYVDNVPSRVMPCIDTTQPVDPKCSTMGNGIFQGVVQDVLNINPFELVQSAYGSGSVVNDICVLRTELVGSQKKGVVNFHSTTRCAPPRKPLICSMSFSGNPLCPIYDIADNAEAERDDSYQPKAPYLKEMTNAEARTIIANIVDSSTTSRQTDVLPLDKYDPIWRVMCQIVQDKWSNTLPEEYSSPSFVLKSCCMVDKIQCENDIILYQWYAVLHRPNHEYAFQIKWKMSYDENDESGLVHAGEIVGNPLPVDIDAPVSMSAVGSGTQFEQIESFVGGVDDEPVVSTSTVDWKPPPYLRPSRIQHDAIPNRPNRPLWTEEDVTSCSDGSATANWITAANVVAVILLLAAIGVGIWLIVRHVQKT